MLRVIDMAAGYLPIEIVGTFCGGHAIPKDSDEETQTNLIIDEMIPEIVKEKQEGRLTAIKNIDVFCEKGNFGVDATFVLNSLIVLFNPSYDTYITNF